MVKIISQIVKVQWGMSERVLSGKSDWIFRFDILPTKNLSASALRVSGAGKRYSSMP